MVVNFLSNWAHKLRNPVHERTLKSQTHYSSLTTLIWTFSAFVHEFPTCVSRHPERTIAWNSRLVVYHVRHYRFGMKFTWGVRFVHTAVEANCSVFCLVWFLLNKASGSSTVFPGIRNGSRSDFLWSAHSGRAKRHKSRRGIIQKSQHVPMSHNSIICKSIRVN